MGVLHPNDLLEPLGCVLKISLPEAWEMVWGGWGAQSFFKQLLKWCSWTVRAENHGSRHSINIWKSVLIRAGEPEISG